MNEDIRRFLEKNNIDFKEISESIDCKLILPRQVNAIASEHGYFYATKGKNVSIADIVGYDYEYRNISSNIFLSMDSFFDSRDEYGYKGRSLGLLDYSPENIIEKLKESFEKEPIVVDDMGDNKYIVSKNGLHRYTVLRALYLAEYQKCNGDKNKIEELRQKYIIPVKSRELDELKTYSIFLLDKFATNIRHVDAEYNLSSQEYTDNIIVDKKDGTKIKLSRDRLANFVQEELKDTNWGSMYEEIQKYEVLKNFISQGGLPIKVQGYNNELMVMEQYQNLTNHYATIIQTSQSIPQTAKELYTQVQTEEDKFAKLAKYLGLDYELSGIDRTHISTIISHLENNSENMQRDMYKITDEDKIDEIRSKVECIEDLVSQACETTQSTYIKEMKSKFIGSYEAKIQQLITDSKIAKFKEGKTAVANQRVSIIGKLFGKEKLKEAQLVNLNKKMEIQRLRTYEKGFRDFSVDGEKGIMTPEIEEFIKLVESKPELENVAKEVKSIFASVIEQENQNNKIVPQNPKVSIRKQLKSIERENEMLSGEIRDIKVQDVKRKRGDVFTKIDNTKSNALIQLETILQNAEKSLHIENERDNDRIMQEVLDR